MLSISDNVVFLNDQPVPWPIIIVRGNEEPITPGSREWPYKGFTVALENGWEIHFCYNTDRKYAEEGTPEIPVYSVGPCDWTDAINTASLRWLWPNHEAWKEHFAGGVVGCDAIQALLENVTSWPSPPQHVLQAIRQARLDGKMSRR